MSLFLSGERYDGGPNDEWAPAAPGITPRRAMLPLVHYLRAPMTIAGEDLRVARSLPDEYAKLTSRSGRRILEMIERRWGDRQEGERRQLGPGLVTTLAPLAHPRSEVTEDLRDTCEQLVATWIRTTSPGRSPVHRSRPESGRRLV